MRIEIPEATPSLNQMLRQHWSKDRKLKDHWRQSVWIALYEQHGRPLWSEPMPKARLTITRHSSRMLDPDNATGGVKHVIDALLACNLIAGDSPEHIELIVQQEKGAARTVIELEAV